MISYERTSPEYKTILNGDLSSDSFWEIYYTGKSSLIKDKYFCIKRFRYKPTYDEIKEADKEFIEQFTLAINNK